MLRSRSHIHKSIVKIRWMVKAQSPFHVPSSGRVAHALDIVFHAPRSSRFVDAQRLLSYAKPIDGDAVARS